MKKIFKIALIAFLSGATFFGMAYLYLNNNLGRQAANVDQKDYTIPFNRTPENCGIAFVYPNDSATLVYLDFDRENIRLLEIEEYDSTRAEYYGYTADYNVSVSYELIEGIIDRVGGIEFYQNGTVERYTGVQVIDLITYGYSDEIKKQILSQIFDKISKNNFSKDDIIFIIKNSKSNLSFVDCIDWMDYLKDMSRRVSFIN